MLSCAELYQAAGFGGGAKIVEIAALFVGREEGGSETLLGELKQSSCNIDLCARTYSSFRASDCTYQPFGGGARQLCEK